MAATATRNSANPLRMEGTRQSADGRSASEQRHRLGSSATNGPRRKRSMAERLFKKHTIEDQGVVSESRGAADTPATPLCKRSEEHTSELQSRLQLVFRLLPLA